MYSVCLYVNDLMALQPKPATLLPEHFAFYRIRKMLQRVYYGAVLFYRMVLEQAAAGWQYPVKMIRIFTQLLNTVKKRGYLHEKKSFKNFLGKCLKPISLPSQNGKSKRKFYPLRIGSSVG